MQLKNGIIVVNTSNVVDASGAPSAFQRRSPKRGSDELLSQSTSVTVSNGGMMSPQNNHSDNNNEAKKVKLDKSNQSNRPSRVIHIRSIPSDVAETEIIQMGMPFGRVTNVLVLKGKNQAFLEMADEVSAKSMVDYFPNNMAQLRGRSVFIQYSNHKELKTDSTHSNAHVNTQAALHAAQALVNHNHSEQVQGGPNSVLRVMVEQMLYPVNLDVLSTIFSRVGKVLKIVTFTKNNTFQALIQYPDAVTAQTAKMSLDGQNIYNACCTLRIEYSKLTHLNVKYNNDKSRDYTNPNLPTGDIALDSALAIGGSGVFSSSPFAVHGLGAPLAAYTQAVGGSCYASLNYTPSPLTGFMLPSPNSQAALGMAGIRMPGQPQTGCVLLVNNLNEETVTPDALFTLFGVYGDVFRVKILFNRKDNALIQMAETHQAQLAKTHLDKIKVFGKHMRVMASKHQSVQMPKEGQPDTGLTKDFTNSGLHRFKKPGSKNYQNIYPPSSTLHLSNIPPNVSEEDITQAFIRNNCVVKAFKFFAKDRKMALVQMGSMEEAVMALIKMHNFQLSESSHLRVSFSKSTI